MSPIAVLDDYQRVAEGMADWSRVGDVTFFDAPFADEAEAAAQLGDFDVIVAMRERTPFPASLLRALPGLRLLVSTGRRNAAIDLEAAAEMNIVVCGTDSSPHGPAELTFTMILALSRGLIGEVESVRVGAWQRGLGRDLHGTTLGLIGLGRLGSRVAAFGQAFGMEVVAWSQNLTQDRCDEVGARLVSKRELLESSDFVSLHLKLGDRSRGVIGADDLAAMKRSAYLINTSRAALVDTAGLVEAVRSGTIAGAGIDVFDTEPLPIDDPLRTEPNILLTPHIGYVTEQTYRVFYPQAVEAIVAWQAGEPIRILA